MQCTSLPFFCIRPFKAARYSTSIFQQLDRGCLKDENEDSPKKKKTRVHCSVITFAPSKRPHSMSQTQIMVPVRPFPPLQWIAITLDWSAAIHRRTLSAKSSISLKNAQTLWLISFQPLKNFHGKSRAFQQSPAFPWKHALWVQVKEFVTGQLPATEKLSQQRPAFFWKHADFASIVYKSRHWWSNSA